MKEQLITFETAKLAKEKGFYWYQPLSKTGYYHIKTGSYFYFGRHGNLNKNNSCSAPTQSLLQKWIREKHKINMLLEAYPDHYWILIWKWEERKHQLEGPSVTGKTYEEALEEGLLEALKLIE